MTDIVKKTFDKIENLLSKDKYYQYALRNPDDKSQFATRFSEQEILESAAFVLSLSTGCVSVADANPKYLHSLSVVQAAWNGQTVVAEQMIEHSIYDKSKLKLCAMSIYVYKGTWKSIADGRRFIGRVLTSTELDHLAFAAGVGGNVDFLKEIYSFEANLLNSALDGALWSKDEDKIQSVNKIGLSLDSYMKSKTNSFSVVSCLREATYGHLVLFVFVLFMTRFF